MKPPQKFGSSTDSFSKLCQRETFGIFSLYTLYTLDIIVYRDMVWIKRLDMQVYLHDNILHCSGYWIPKITIVTLDRCAGHFL